MTHAPALAYHARQGEPRAASDIVPLAGVRVALGGLVVDRTGLSGPFYIDLAEGPDVLGAVEEQLGLRFERRKVQMDVLVVDSVSTPEPD